jgi:hypothetical protein
VILADLRHYLKQHPRVALADLVNHFNVDADALRGMLGRWISKGNVRKTSQETGCGTSCCKCDPALIEFYEWIER